jgi:lysozyme
MNLEMLYNDLARDEGEVLHCYKDKMGLYTISIGVCIDKRVGCGITEEESQLLFKHRAQRVVNALSSKLEFWPDLSDVRQAALANMAYQLGVSDLLAFKKMLQGCRTRDWQAAYEQALASDWARQTPHRARRIARMLRDDEPEY